MDGGTGTTCIPDCFFGPLRATKLVQSASIWSRRLSELEESYPPPEKTTTDSSPEQYESERFRDLGQPVSWLDIILRVAPKDNAQAVYELGRLMLVESQGDWIPATQHMTWVAFESSPKTSTDWERWHELLSIRDSRGMNPSEQQEYEEFEAIVAELDAQEEARSNAALDLLEKKHARVISSIERLTEAVRRAAQRDR